jgi:hypothetical protein
MNCRIEITSATAISFVALIPEWASAKLEKLTAIFYAHRHDGLPNCFYPMAVLDAQKRQN